jgi:hypothetical protein
MTHKSSVKRLIGLGTWLAIIALALAFLLRWRMRTTSTDENGADQNN